MKVFPLQLRKLLGNFGTVESCATRAGGDFYARFQENTKLPAKLQLGDTELDVTTAGDQRWALKGTVSSRELEGYTAE